MVPFYFKKVTGECMEHCIELYVDTLLSRRGASLNPAAVDRVTDDIAVFEDFFSQHRRQKMVQGKLKPIVVLNKLLDAESEMASMVRLLAISDPYETAD